MAHGRLPGPHRARHSGWAKLTEPEPREARAPASSSARLTPSERELTEPPASARGRGGPGGAGQRLETCPCSVRRAHPSGPRCAPSQARVSETGGRQSGLGPGRAIRGHAGRLSGPWSKAGTCACLSGLWSKPGACACVVCVCVCAAARALSLSHPSPHLSPVMTRTRTRRLGQGIRTEEQTREGDYQASLDRMRPDRHPGPGRAPDPKGRASDP